MAATATTDIIEALRYTYADNERVLYLFNQEVPLYNVLSKVKKSLGGRGQFLMPILTKNPGVWKGITQGGAIPTPLQPDTAEASWALQEFVGAYDVSWKLVQDARNSRFAFQQVISMMDDGVKRRFFRLLNADLLGYGRGELAMLSAADNVDPITSRFLPRAEVGMVVDFMDASDDDTKLTNGDSRTITAIDPIARTVTLGGNSSGTAAGDYLTIEDTCDISVNAKSLHMFGMLQLLEDVGPGTSGNAVISTVVNDPGGIDRDTAGNEYWRSVVLGNAGTNRPWTEDLGLQAEDAVREKGGGQLNAWFSNLAIGRRYHEILRADTIMSMGSAGPLSGGYGRTRQEVNETGKSPYEFGGQPWHFDPFFDSNTIIGFDKTHFFMGTGENELPKPISEVFDGQPFFTETDNAAYQVRWYFQGQLITDNPAAGVKIEDVAEA